MTTVEILQPKEGERSYGIKVQTKKLKYPFVIPVLDCRDGEEVREQIQQQTKSANVNRGSMYLRPSYGGGGGCYQNSYKKFNN